MERSPRQLKPATSSSSELNLCLVHGAFIGIVVVVVIVASSSWFSQP
jgi:hypothetical protein